MAFEPVKINPIDKQPRKAVGIDIPFSGNAVFNSTYETKEAVKANIINYLLTGVGERFFNPNFGSGLRNELFANISLENLNALEFSVQTRLGIHFPNLDITAVSITAEEDRNFINLSVNFKMKGTLIEEELNINFE